MKTRTEKLLSKLNKAPVDNDMEFLACLIDLDDRIIQIEEVLGIKKIKVCRKHEWKKGAGIGRINEKGKIITDKFCMFCEKCNKQKIVKK